jgi:hypothetical protein
MTAGAQAHLLAPERALVEQAGNRDLGGTPKGEIGRLGQVDDGGVREHGGMVR